MATNTTDTQKLAPTYNTLEEIQMRKNQLNEAIERDSELIRTLWDDVFKKKEDATKGEYIAGIVNNSIVAIDAFLLVRKLMKSYSRVLDFFNFGRKKHHK